LLQTYDARNKSPILFYVSKTVSASMMKDKKNPTFLYLREEGIKEQQLTYNS